MNEDLPRQVAEICDRNRDALLAIIGLLLARQSTQQQESDSQAQQTRRMMDSIKAKDFITVNEAATLLSCSAQHLRNLVDAAMEGTASYPIPSRNLDGVIVFSIPELMEWSRVAKPRRKHRRKKKTSSGTEQL